MCSDFLLAVAGRPPTIPNRILQFKPVMKMNSHRFLERVQAGGLALACAVLPLLWVGCAETSSVPEAAKAEPAAAAPTTASAPSTPAPPPAPAPAPKPPASPDQELPPLPAGNWHPLFDGHSLDGWTVTDFAGHGDVEVKNGQIVMGMGATLTGVNLVKTNDVPTMNYELALDARKLEGSDFFCALTFPVGDNCCSFLLGGWGGGVVGISSIDGNDASLNQTTKYLNFEMNRWYRVRVRVTKAKLEAWVGSLKMVDLELEGKRISVRPGEIELNQPFGVATYQTTGAIKDVQYRPL